MLAVGYAHDHDRGAVHRGLKLENVLLENAVASSLVTLGLPANLKVVPSSPPSAGLLGTLVRRCRLVKVDKY